VLVEGIFLKSWLDHCLLGYWVLIKSLFSLFSLVKGLSPVHKHHSPLCVHLWPQSLTEVSFVSPMKATVKTLNPPGRGCIGKLSSMSSDFQSHGLLP
jgi:hypothetical protein